MLRPVQCARHKRDSCFHIANLEQLCRKIMIWQKNPPSPTMKPYIQNSSKPIYNFTEHVKTQPKQKHITL